MRRDWMITPMHTNVECSLRLKIALVPVGPVEGSVIEQLSMLLKRNFPGQTIIASDGIRLPDQAYDPKRRQYNSDMLLALLSSLGVEADKLLGVTEADLYVEGLNFVFGEGLSPGKVCVVSTYRLRPEASRQDGTELFFQRLIKEAVHELGHTMGLGHCRNASCVMYFSNGIVDTDRKTDSFCDICKAKFSFLHRPS